MPMPMKDISGMRFGKLVAIKPSHKIENQWGWLCHCDCGKEVVVRSFSLRNGDTSSCGCIRSDIAKEKREKAFPDVRVNGIRKLPSVEFLNERYVYKEGRIFYRKSGKDGAPGIGGPDGRPYRFASVFQKRIPEHRIVMALHGRDIDGLEVDHINGDSLDNRIENLRAVDRKTNARNQLIRDTNSSGFTGVHFDKSRNKWMAHGSVDGRFENLGRFDSKADAISARQAFNAKNGFGPAHGQTLNQSTKVKTGNN